MSKTRDMRREMKRSLKKLAADLLETVVKCAELNVSLPVYAGDPGERHPLPPDLIGELLKELRGQKP